MGLMIADLKSKIELWLLSCCLHGWLFGTWSISIPILLSCIRLLQKRVILLESTIVASEANYSAALSSVMLLPMPDILLDKCLIKANYSLKETNSLLAVFNLC